MDLEVADRIRLCMWGECCIILLQLTVDCVTEVNLNKGFQTVT